MAQHTITAAFVTGGLFMLGISAWQILRGKQAEIFLKSARIALIFTAVSSILVAITGHSHGQHTAETQPMKMAAMEALWETEQPASFSLFAIIDEENQENRFEISIPYMLSILAHNSLTAEVKGMNDLQRHYEERFGEGDYIPPVAVVYWSFRLMVGLGTLFIVASIVGLILLRRNKLTTSKLFLRLAIIMMFLPILANTLGWIVAEMGRQPWVAYYLMLTRDGISPNVSSGTMLFTTVAFTLIYGILAAVSVFLVHRVAKEGIQSDSKEVHGY